MGEQLQPTVPVEEQLEELIPLSQTRKPHSFDKFVKRHYRKNRKHVVRPWIPQRDPKRIIQMDRHKDEPLVLCFRENGYCLTNGDTSYVKENDPNLDLSLLQDLNEVFVTKLYVTDDTSLYRWAQFKRLLDSEYWPSPLPAINMKWSAGNCPTCKSANCLRWIAVDALNSLRKRKMDSIPHNS